MEGVVDELTDGLDSTERLILLMHWGDRCSVDEIADVLAVDLRAVSSVIDRLRARATHALVLSLSSHPARSPDPLH